MQHFGLERFEAKEKVRHVYGKDGGYDCEVEGYDLKLDALHDNEMSLMDAMEFLNRPANPVFVSQQVARLRSVLKRRNEGTDDMILMIDTYGQYLEKYPQDIVAHVISEIIKSEKWFPTVSEIVVKLDKQTELRRKILRLFEQKRTSNLIGKANE